MSSTTSLHIKDFPLEIRQQIYHHLLCTFTPAPARASLSERLSEHNSRERSGPVDLLHSNQAQVLLLNKAFFAEAQLYMRSTNLFVKATFNCDVISLSRSLQLERLPYWGRRIRHNVETFKHFVMVHEITEIGVPVEQSVSIIFLWQHIDRWIDVLKDFTASLSDLDFPRIHHAVTLVDPYAGSQDTTTTSLLTPPLKEKLLKPYLHLNGLQNFTLTNAPSTPWTLTLQQTLTTPSPQSRASHLTHLTTLSSNCHPTSSPQETLTLCTEGITHLLHNLSGPRSSPLFTPPTSPSTIEFANALSTHHHTFLIQHARALLTTLTLLPQNFATVHPKICDTMENARRIASYYRGATWMLSVEQEVEILLLCARAGKLGHRAALLDAKRCCRIALIMMPGCQEAVDELASVEELLVVSNLGGLSV